MFTFVRQRRDRAQMTPSRCALLLVAFTVLFCVSYADVDYALEAVKIYTVESWPQRSSTEYIAVMYLALALALFFF